MPFFTTPHYDGYPYVLVRLDEVELGELVEEAARVTGSRDVRRTDR